jgi:hypothetical protein
VSKSLILGLFVVVGVVILAVIGLRDVDRHRCEVCITFRGETACRTGEGRTREDAQRSAAESCCAVLPTASMAERIQCSQSVPTRLNCE